MKPLAAHLSRFLKAYRGKDVFSVAASLSFFMVLSLIPVLLMLVSLLGLYLGKSENALGEIAAIIDSVIPMAKRELMENLESMVAKKATFGFMGFAFLFLMSSTLFASLEKAINQLLHSGERHHFLLTRFLFIFWVALMVCLFLFSFLWDSFFKSLPNLNSHLWFLVVAWIFFVSVLMLLPKKRIRFGVLSRMGLLFALLLTASRFLFNLYTGYAISRYNVVYGSLSSLILGLLWIFYFNNILLGCVLWIDTLSSPASDHAQP